MSLLTKSVVVALFIGFLFLLLGFLPSTAQYPLPAEFATSLGTVFGYYFAWSSVFTALNTLLACSIIFLTVELLIMVWKVVIWGIGVVSRMIG